MDKDQKAGGGATPTRLVIDRSRWLRGEGSDKSFLLRPSDGKMCCLGFYGVACGLPSDTISDVDAPARTKRPMAWPQWLIDGSGGHTPAARNLMNENDRDARESEIARLFAEHGVEVEFIDGTGDPAGGPLAPDSASAGLTGGGK